jgi:hypothetical protein
VFEGVGGVTYRAEKSKLMARERTVQISGDKLSKLFRDTLLSQRAFGEKVQIKSTRLSIIMRPGVHGILKDRFGEMARGLGLTEQQLLEKIGTQSESADSVSSLETLLTSGDLGARTIEQMNAVRVTQLAQLAFWNLAKRVTPATRREMEKLTKLLGRIEKEMEEKQALERERIESEERQKRAG